MSYFRSPEYIQYLIKEWKWHENGSTLDRWLDDHSFLNYDSSDEEIAEELENFLSDRLYRVEYQLGSLTRSTQIERSLVISKDSVDKFFEDGHSIGKYWATDNSNAYWAENHKEPVDILVLTTLSEVTIDWKTTIASRIDYDLGDDEYEITLVEGSPIKSLTKAFLDGDEVKDLYLGKSYTA